MASRLDRIVTRDGATIDFYGGEHVRPTILSYDELEEVIDALLT